MSFVIISFLSQKLLQQRHFQTSGVLVASDMTYLRNVIEKLMPICSLNSDNFHYISFKEKKKKSGANTVTKTVNINTNTVTIFFFPTFLLDAGIPFNLGMPSQLPVC